MRPSDLHALGPTDPAARARWLAIQPAATRAALAPVRASRRSAATVTAVAHREGDVVTLVCKGLRLVNIANQREHWSDRWDRTTEEQALVRAALAGITPPCGPWGVTIVRVGPRRMDDDGATISAKGLRDTLSGWVGVDDGDPRWTWRVVQERGGYCVRVTVRGGL